MAITVIDEIRVLQTGSGNTVTVNVNNLTGTNVVIVAACSARTTNIAFSITDVTWDGGSMGAPDVTRQEDLNGFPRGIAANYSIAIGNPSNLSASVVMTLDTSSAMRCVTVYVLGGVAQTSFVHDTATQGVISAATNTSITLNTSQATDICISVVTCANQLTGTPGAGQVGSQEQTNSPTSGTHLASYVLPGAQPTQTMSWSWGNSSFAHAGATYIDAGVVPPAIALLDEDTVVGTGTNGDPVTISLGPLTGSDVCVILCASASKETTKLTPTSATWDGGAMDPGALAAGDPNSGAGHQLAEIYVLPIGNPSGLTADVIYTLGGTPSGAGRICYAAAYSGVNQSNPIFNTATFGDGPLGSGTSRVDTVNVPDDSLVIDCMSISEQLALTFTQGPGETVHANLDNGAGNGEGMALGVATFNPGATPTQAMGWSWGASAVRAHSVASFNIADPLSITSTVSSRGTNAIIDVQDRDITVNGLGLQGPGDTVVVYADGSDYATATKVVQLTTLVTNTSVNWVEPNLGTIGRGSQYIFVVKNFGLGSESRSDAFAIQVEAFVPNPNSARRVYETTGATGNTVVVDDLPFEPKAAIIQTQDNATPDSLAAPAQLSVCFVAGNAAGGVAIVSSTSPLITRRRQALGSGALMILSTASSAGVDQLTGTPALTSNGININFTNNTAGKELYITFFGGDSVEAELTQFTVSSGSVGGLPFQPDLIFGTGVASSVADDTSFAMLSFGMCVAGPTQCSIGARYDGTNRTSATDSTNFIAQFGNSGTVYDWEMAITSINSDGFSWSGTNADLGYALSINLGGAQATLLDFITTSNGTNGVSENLPDFGFDPGIIITGTSALTNSVGPTNVGARWSVGTCVGALDHGCTYAHHNASTGTGTARQQNSDTLLCMSSSATTSLTFTVECTAFGSISTLRYPLKPAAALHLCVLAVQSGDTIAGDTDGAAVMTSFSGRNLVS